MKPTAFLISTLLWATFAAESQSFANPPPEGALNELKLGNSRFVSGKPSHCLQSEEIRKDLVSGQTPNAIILSCSDSRVPPELVFDQGLGSLFTIRIAGNILSGDTVASIEYAILHLGSRLIVILGHDSCGAVQAALGTPKGKSAGSKSLNQLILEIQRNLGQPSGSTSSSEDKNFRWAVKKNVSAVAAALPKKSALVKSAVESGKVKVIEAIYNLETGKVEFWN